jgi:NADP-dependent 3-hydroxy acid dehydrogenase YdfG
MKNSLANLTAVVTGASSGIGKAIALGVSSQGGSVCLLGRNTERLRTVAEAIKKEGNKAISYEIDLTVDGEVQALMGRLQEDFGRIDILVHSAAVIALNRFENATVREFDWQYRTNVRAVFSLTQSLLPFLTSSQGQVVFINSTAGLTANANASQYAATKHALKALADSLREEVNLKGIRVLSVFLGRTATPMQAAVYQMEGHSYRPELLIQPEDVAAVVSHVLTLPRTVEVTEIRMRPLVKL